MSVTLRLRWYKLEADSDKLKCIINLRVNTKEKTSRIQLKLVKKLKWYIRKYLFNAKESSKRGIEEQDNITHIENE